MNNAQAAALAILLTFLAAEYVEASEPVETERSSHAPHGVGIGMHLDYEAQPKLPPPVNEMPPGGRVATMMPIYEAWYEQQRAANQAAMETTMRRNSALLDSPVAAGASIVAIKSSP